MSAIETERLRIVPFTHDLALAALRDRSEVARLLAATVPDEWPGPEMASYLPTYARQVEREPERGDWVRLALRSADRALIGDMGFHGPPDAAGTVEIGYRTAPAYRRQGYTSEGVRGLIAWAFGRPEVRRIVAECAPDNAGSIRILEGANLRRVGTRGRMLRWELRRTGE